MWWTTGGFLSGYILGGTLSGAFGGLLLAVFGFLGGLIRDRTGQTVVTHLTQSWNQLSDVEKQLLIDRVLGNPHVTVVRRAPQPTAPPAPRSTTNPDALTPAQVAALTNSAGQPECQICLVNKVNVMFEPCKHAVVCAACCAAMHQANMPSCPTCRGTIGLIRRVFLA